MKKHIIYILICFWVAKIGAQPKNAELGDIQMASPEVAALGKYIDIPVSSFTGVGPVSIPIHQLQEGPLSVPISLSYHGSGIRAAETASWVGLGWNLNASGIISRTILGISDENINGFLNINYTYTDATILNQVNAGLIDGEQDLFSYSLPGGISGKFIINKDINEIIQFPKTDNKIEVLGQNLEEFTVITPDGTRYIFGETGTENYDGFTKVERGSPTQRNSPKRQHTEWYLRRIESYDGNYHIDFNYISKVFGSISPASESYNRIFSNYDFSTGNNSPFLSINTNYGANGEEKSFGQFIVLTANIRGTQFPLYGNFQGHETKQIASITTSTTIVEFKEGNQIRQDINSYPYTTSRILDEIQFHDCKYLDEIEIRPIGGNTFCKTFNFNYGYFKSVDAPEYTFDVRLKLNQVQEISCTAAREVVPPYIFDYYKEEGTGKSYYFIPSRLTKAIDAWGYYNGAIGNDDLEFNIPPTTLSLAYGADVVTLSHGSASRATDELSMRLGALRKITFPEKGYTEFDLEANTTKKVQFDTIIVPPKKTNGLPPIIPSCSADNDSGDCCPNSNYSELINFDQDYVDRGVFRVVLEDVRADTHLNSMLCEDDVADMPWDGYVYVALTPEGATQPLSPIIQYNHTQDAEFFLKLKEQYPNIQPGNYTIGVEAAFARGAVYFWEEEYTDISYNQKVGGLRIKEKKTYDQNHNLLRLMSYSYENPDDLGFSSGVLYKKPVFGHIIAGDDIIATGTGGSVSIYYAKLAWTASTTVPLTDIQGYHIGYKNVKTTESNGAFTTYLHKTRALDPEIGTTLLPYPLAPLPYFYDNGILIQSEQGTSNETIASSESAGQEIFQSISPKNAVRVEITTGGNLGALIFPNRFQYQKTGFYRQFNQTNIIDGVTTITNHGYDPNNRFLSPTSITTTNSDEKSYTRRFHYPHDFTGVNIFGTAPVYQEMVAKNIIQHPIITLEYVTINSLEVPIKGNRTQFSMFNSLGSNVGNTITEANPYPHTFERYEMTWDDNGAPVVNGDGWNIVGTIDAYRSNGKPAEFTRDGWKKETYTWHPVNNLLATRTFEGFTWQYNYHPSTRLISKIIDIDGQDTDYAFDGLMRLDSIIERDRNVITDFSYSYTGQNVVRPQNYVKSTITFEPTIGSDFTEKTSYQYFDDIGRLTQTVNQAYSPDQKDVVKAIAYDQFGRATHNYEVFETNTSNGVFATTIPTGTPFTFLEYDDTPLNRLIKETPPDWYATTYEYGNNSSSLTIDGTTYGIGSLNVSTIRDPNNRESINYTDKRGRVLLSKNKKGTEETNTYTLYDNKDRVKTILPPGVTSATSPLAYQYRYDGADNVLHKYIPDMGWSEMLYDERDLLVAQRAGNLKADAKWMVTAYDDYGRPNKTGLLSLAGIPLDSDLNDLAPTEIWTETFYDGFDGSSTISGSQYLGKIRRSETQVLNGNTLAGKTIFRTFDYDTDGRMTRDSGEHHLSGFDSYMFTYDWADNVLTSPQTHKVGALATQTFMNRQTFDHKGRLINKYHTIPNNVEQHLCQVAYDHKDLMKRKSLGGITSGFLQEINYEYLPNRFLKGINPTMTTSDLFQLNINYDQEIAGLSGTGQKNGNITSLSWRIKGSSSQTYGYTYDYLNRLTIANYGGVGNAYGTTYNYDNRGNILNITRRGIYGNGSSYLPQQIDNLTLNYLTTTSNQVQTITDAAPCPTNKAIHQVLDNTEMHAVGQLIEADNIVQENADITYQAGISIILEAGFEAKAGTNFVAKIGGCPTSGYETGGFVQRSTNAYLYDAEGNQTRDPNKGITILYNYFNLPYQATFDNGNMIEWAYDGNGTKLQKITKRNGVSTPLLVQDYIGGIEYKNSVLEAIYYDDGRAVFENGVFEYQYNLSDHLGNNRVLFSDTNGDGSIDANTEVLQTTDYYPFGMEMKGDFSQNAGRDNKYLYNGKELDTDFGLNWYHYGARMYDPAIGRFTGVDPISDQFANLSTYNYASNKPVNSIDLHGLQAVFFMNGSGKTKSWSDNKQTTTGNIISSTNDVSSRMINNYEAASGQKASSFRKASIYASNYIDSFGGFSDANDAAVLTQGQNLDGSSASTTDFVLAGIGIFLPVISGSGVKKGITELISTEPGMQSLGKIDEMADGLKGATNQTEFNRMMFDEDIYAYPKVIGNPIDGKTYIIDGHHRLQAAEKAGTGFDVKVQNVNLEDTGFSSFQEMIDASNGN